jgi:hypothetical protein
LKEEAKTHKNKIIELSSLVSKLTSDLESSEKRYQHEFQMRGKYEHSKTGGEIYHSNDIIN